MKRLALLLLLTTCPVLAQRVQADVANDRIVLLEPLRFPSGQAELTPVAVAIVDELADVLRANPSFTRIVIEGHTDNEGDDAANTQLSKARADTIARRLVTTGIDVSRLTTRGYGSASPLVGNDTADGRERNRRVEILVLEVSGKGTARAAPVAEVAATLNVVQARAPEQTSWRDANIGLDLFRAWRVNTKDESAAEVSFADNSRAQLRENTLIVIFGVNQYQERTANVELSQGSLRTRIDELIGGQPLRIDTTAGELAVGRGSSLLGVDAAGMNRIANHGGDAVRVKSKPKAKQAPVEVAVDAGMGTRMEPGKAPEPPRPLPPQPAWQQPLSTTWTSGQPVVSGVLSANPGLQHRVEVNIEGKSGVVFMATIPAGVDRIELRSLPKGSYRVAVAAIDAAGLEGIAHSTSIVVTDPPAPPLLPRPTMVAMVRDEAVAPTIDEPSLVPVVAGGVAVLVISAAVAGAAVLFANPQDP
jgi:hypothetical protein